MYTRYGLGEVNVECKSIMEFSSVFDLTTDNTWFRKTDDHLMTYKSGVTYSKINFFLIHKFDWKICLDCNVISGKSLTIQHRVLVMDVRINRKAKRRSHMGVPHIKW